MSLRDIIHLTQQPQEPKIDFAAQIIKVLVSMIIKFANVCEDEDIALSKKVHCFDMKSNEWHIAVMQIYQGLFKEDSDQKWQRNEYIFDNEGNIVEAPRGPGLPEIQEKRVTMSSALRPLLEFVDGYRRRVAAPNNTLVRTKYSNYADLDYIKNRLKKVEDDVNNEI